MSSPSKKTATHPTAPAELRSWRHGRHATLTARTSSRCTLRLTCGPFRNPYVDLHYRRWRLLAMVGQIRPLRRPQPGPAELPTRKAPPGAIEGARSAALVGQCGSRSASPSAQKAVVGRSGSFAPGRRRYQRMNCLMTVPRSEPDEPVAVSRSAQSSSLMRTDRCCVTGLFGTAPSLPGVRTDFNGTSLRCTYTRSTLVYVHRAIPQGSR